MSLAGWLLLLLSAVSLLRSGSANTCAVNTTLTDSVFVEKVTLTQEALGARCVQAADLDGDGLVDVISASSTDNSVAWYRNMGGRTFSTKRQISFSSNGARIVTTGDVNGDGIVDLIAASYYDNTVGWHQNDGNGVFSTRKIISTTVANAQGVAAIDVDGDGDIDVVTASSGDNTVAWFENLGGGAFCEKKTIVSSTLEGARTVQGADLDGDGDVDLVSASKDDNTIAWHRNLDGTGSTWEKIIVNASALGAYSLVAVDMDADGYVDLVTASNADNTVAWYKNNGQGVFTFNQIYSSAVFVLSVFAGDFDRDGDIDVASANYFDSSPVNWYENMGSGTWQAHSLFTNANAGGHYVVGADMDNDGDMDLLAATNRDNSVLAIYASTSCDTTSSACCPNGQSWNGTMCVFCAQGTYGIGSGSTAQCTACPTTCTIPGLIAVPTTCSTTTGCQDATQSLLNCACAADQYKSNLTDTCEACPADRTAPALQRTTMPNDLYWEGFSIDNCSSPEDDNFIVMLVWSILGGLFGAIIISWGLYRLYKRHMTTKRKLETYEREQHAKILTALGTVTKLEYPMQLVPAKTFLASTCLISHEELRNQGKLTVLDTLESIQDFENQGCHVIFFSHQWTALDKPDHTNTQHSVMTRVLPKVAEEAEWPLDQCYIWVDYASIPQQHSGIQQLAIFSLNIYSSTAHAFVVVAPTVQHKDTGNICDRDTYSRRAWCRAEQACHALSHGAGAMYLATESQLTKMHFDWVAEALQVFHGEMTCCRLMHENRDQCDRERLVIALLGLLGNNLLLEGGKGNADQVQLFDLLLDNRSEIFPRHFEFVKKDPVTGEVTKENRVLFGDLVERMEAHAKECNETKPTNEESFLMQALKTDSPAATDTSAKFDVGVDTPDNANYC